ncbi:hypothetical protein Q4506_15390 [Colwellia sp. 4_MG-2023]|uniref:hypothetical protein n=1 Tax=unclassified Colwellia TaxID=196834 RepID=UPI0026E2D8E2|nr:MULTISPECIES: hypothetical protein [unclassified Colwellia]MDO6508446.1 hypothetical protein [Colwellia sp. 5_MG-2023]MDO6557067.1 hypothetical protein [Colwellia sp. 4_MG-2023]
MEINSKAELDAKVEFNKIDQIQKIESKLHRLSFIPLYFFAFLLLAYFGLDLANDLSGAVIILIISIGIVGQSNVQRTNLLKELFELKYSK